MVKQTALSVGSGGLESTFEHQEGGIFEKSKINYASAYMLVYIRDCDRDEIMREVPMDDIPRHLKLRFDEENMINHKLEED